MSKVERNGKKRMTLRSGRAVLGDLSNQGGTGAAALLKKSLASQAAASGAAHRGGGGLVARKPAAASKQQQQLRGRDDAAYVQKKSAKRQQDEEEEEELECSEDGEEEGVQLGGETSSSEEGEEKNSSQEASDEGEERSSDDDGSEEKERSGSEVKEQESEEEQEESEVDVDLRASDSEVDIIESVPPPIVARGKRKAATSSSSSSGGGAAAKAKEEKSTKKLRKTGPVPFLPSIRPLHPADRKDKDDVTQALDYVEDIHQYLKAEEGKWACTPYMNKQKEINAKMRAILVDWIVEVHLKFKLVTPTLYLAVQLIDRYCMFNNVSRTKLQLVGVTALLIACKFEEIYPPEVRDCVYITDNAYTREEVLKMEQKVLKFFNFRVSMPTVHGFLTRYLKIAEGGHLCAHRAQYFTERALQEHEVLEWRPSLIAAAAVYLAKKNETLDAWPASMIEYSGYTESELLSCATLMSKWIHETTQTQSRRLLNAVKKKFSCTKYMDVGEVDHLRL